EGVIRIRWIAGVGLEVSLLRFGPAALRGVLIAEREMQDVCVGALCKQILDTALGGDRVLLTAQAEQPGMRIRIARIHFQQAEIARLRAEVLLRARVECRQAE